MGERDDARREVEQKREHMSQIAHEVSRRMTPRYAKERAREMARDSMSRVRDRAVESSWFGPVLGAAIGALAAKALQSRARERSWDRERWDRWDVESGLGYPRGYPDDPLGYARYEHVAGEAFPREAGGEPPSAMRERISGAGEKVTDAKERVRAKADEMKGRVQEAASSMRERLPDRERLRSSAREDTGLWALGAMALGALFGFALPESDRERELLEPARRKARELGEQALEKGTEAMEKATEKVRSAGEAGPAGQPAATPTGTPPTPIH